MFCRIRGQRIAFLVLEAMVENEQDQAAAARVSCHRKILRDLESDLIRIGSSIAIAPGRGSGGYAGDKTGICRWLEGAFRPDKGVNQAIEALTRKPKLDVPDIFPAAANDNFSFVVREARRLNLVDPDCHSFPLPWDQPDAVDCNLPGLPRDPVKLAKRDSPCHGQIASARYPHPDGQKVNAPGGRPWKAGCEDTCHSGPALPRPRALRIGQGSVRSVKACRRTGLPQVAGDRTI